MRTETERSGDAEYWATACGPGWRFSRAFRPVASIIVRSGWRIHVHGQERIPLEGPVILAANHTSVLDGPVLYGITRRPVHALVKREMFAGALGPALRAMGQISVDRFACDPAAVKACLAVLHRGQVVAVYPEGTRGRGDFATVKPGAAYLAMCTGAPIVPVVCLGVRADGQSKNGIPRLRGAVDVVFGSPIDVERVGWPRRQHLVREQSELVGTQLRAHVQYACELTGRSLPKLTAKK
jgi:1-acyl-sn-glycerol-3-phosphate acyltransferase